MARLSPIDRRTGVVEAVEAAGSFSPDTTTEDLLELDPLRANDPHLAFVDWLEGIKASADRSLIAIASGKLSASPEGGRLRDDQE